MESQDLRWQDRTKLNEDPKPKKEKNHRDVLPKLLNLHEYWFDSSKKSQYVSSLLLFVLRDVVGVPAPTFRAGAELSRIPICERF
jgi:hypothetical protein